MHPILGAAVKIRIFASICLILFLCLCIRQCGRISRPSCFQWLWSSGCRRKRFARGSETSRITDEQGGYIFPDLSDGVWNIQIEMQAFFPLYRDVTIGSGMATGIWELRLTSDRPDPWYPNSSRFPPAFRFNCWSDAKIFKRAQASRSNQYSNTISARRCQVNRRVSLPQSGPDAASASPPLNGVPFGDQNPADLNQRAADGFLISGTANNGGSSPFALSQAFGNNRRGTRSLYNGNVGFVIDNSASMPARFR